MGLFMLPFAFAIAKGKHEKPSVSLCMCVLWHLFTLASAELLPTNTPPTQTRTYTYIYTQKKEEVWIMLALRDGQAKQTHLETIGGPEC